MAGIVGTVRARQALLGLTPSTLGVTASVAELNYMGGVTSNVQTQLNAKQPLDADLTALAAIAGAEGDIIYHNGTSWARLPKGTAGQVLTMNGGATAPEWV